MTAPTAAPDAEDTVMAGGSTHRPRDHDPIWAVVLAVGISLLAWFRMSPVTRSTMWAEDGAVFLPGAVHTNGPLGSLLTPYDGYLHVVPRLVAELTLLFPPERYALAMSAASCVVAGLLGAVVFMTSRDVVPPVAARVVLAVLPVVAPPTAREVLGNAANLHWFVLYTVPWLLMYRPRTRRGAWALAVVALVASLSEVQSLLFVPLLFWRWRDRRTWPPKAAFALGAAAQLGTVLTSARAPKAAGVPAVSDIIGGYLVNGVLSSWTGSIEAVTMTVARFGWLVSVLFLVPVIASVVLVFRRGQPQQRLAVAVLSAASVLIWVVAFVVNRPDYVYARPDATGEPTLVILRYAVVPATFLLAVLVLGAVCLPRRWWAGVVTSVVAVPLATVAVLNFAVGDATRSAGPVWAPQVATVREDCRTQPPTAEERVEVAPAGHGFAASLPCALLQPQP